MGIQPGDTQPYFASLRVLRLGIPRATGIPRLVVPRPGVPRLEIIRLRVPRLDVFRLGVPRPGATDQGYPDQEAIISLYTIIL